MPNTDPNSDPAARAAAEAELLRPQADLIKAKRELATARQEPQAAIGSVTGSNLDGSVVVTTDAGKGEATLLASKAFDRAATKVTTAISKAVAGKRVVLIARSGDDTFRELSAIFAAGSFNRPDTRESNNRGGRTGGSGGSIGQSAAGSPADRAAANYRWRCPGSGDETRKLLYVNTCYFTPWAAQL